MHALRRLLAIASVLPVLKEVTPMEPCLESANSQEGHPTLLPDDRTHKNLDSQTIPNDVLIAEDEGCPHCKHQAPEGTTTDPSASQKNKLPTPSRWCNKYDRKKRCRYKLSDELNKKGPSRDILAQLDYDIEEQEMDKRSRIELLSYLDAALKNKNIELDVELRHLAKEEQKLNDKEKVESVNSNAATLTANIEQLDKRIKDLDERILRMKKMRKQKVLERIPEAKKAIMNLKSQQNSPTDHHRASSFVRETTAPQRFTKFLDGRVGLLNNNQKLSEIKGSKTIPRMNLGYVPYQMPVPYSDPLQILRLTNPDLAALSQPSPWLASGWAGYVPNMYPYPIERPLPQSMYEALARHQALPVPSRKS